MNNYTKINNKNIKNNKNNKNNKFKKLTKKINHKSLQKGGNCNHNHNHKEKFEAQSLSNFDFDKISVSKYINANIDWGIMPGPPPKPDCTIL